jgi:hypothetical protein
MPRSITDPSFDPIYDQIRGILGEHFENYCFIVMDEIGEIFYDYNHLPAGKMLLYEAQKEIIAQNIEIEWIEEDPEEPEEND